jgi:hypothetical protein
MRFDANGAANAFRPVGVCRVRQDDCAALCASKARSVRSGFQRFERAAPPDFQPHDGCDHFATLETLTMKVLATDRQGWPASTAATTRSRRSRE